MVFCKNAPKWGCLVGGDFERNTLKKRGGGGSTLGWGILRHNRWKSPKYQRFSSKTTNVGFFVWVGRRAVELSQQRANLVNFYGIFSCENF